MDNSSPLFSPEKFSEIQFNLFANYKHAFDKWSLEDIYTLDKAITLKNVDNYWEQGLYHIGRLQLLSMRYSYDYLLKQIYEYMYNSVHEWFTEKQKWGNLINDNDLAVLFKDQPVLYNENMLDGNPRTVLYDVKNCFYKNRLIKKYPKMYDVIQDMVMG